MKLDPKTVFKGDGLNLLARIARDLPKVATRAMNNLAWQARSEVRDSLKDHFILRNKRMNSSIRSKNGHFEKGVPASIYSLDDWVARHEEGGLRSSTAGHRLAIPITRRPGSPHGIRKDVKVILRGRGRPKSLMARNHRIMPVPGKDGRNEPLSVLFGERREKVKSEKTGKPIIKRRPIFLYFLVETARIEPKLGMRDTVVRVVKENANKALNDALTDHLKRRRK